MITNNISRNYTGVYAKAGSGTVLEECLIADNTAQYASGGGAYLGDGVVARNCRFIGNMAENQAAGGIYAKGCTLSGCLISNNVAKCGGGVCVVTDDIAATIVGCRFIDNEASFAGGGLHVGFIYNVSNSDGTEGYANVADCIFVKNRANADSSTSGSYYGGGAVALRTGDISAGLFDRCVFADNETAGYGGAFTLRTSENSEHGKALVAVRNSLFTGNRAITGGTSKRYGGAMYLTSGDPVMVENCTFSGNEDESLNAGTAGNDDVCVRWSGVRVRNCIFATPRFETNDIYKTACETNGFVGTGLPNNRVLASKGNFAVADAKFADAANGDFSLRQDSPFVNVAATLGWMTDLSRDLAGNKRISSNGPDIGAYECQIPIGLRVMIR